MLNNNLIATLTAWSIHGTCRQADSEIQNKIHPLVWAVTYKGQERRKFQNKDVPPSWKQIYTKTEMCS